MPLKIVTELLTFRRHSEICLLPFSKTIRVEISGVPWEDLYANDLVITAESLEECVRRPSTWKEAMEEKGLRVNAGKMIMICGSGKFPCTYVALEWAATTSSAMAASTGSQQPVAVNFQPKHV